MKARRLDQSSRICKVDPEPLRSGALQFLVPEADLEIVREVLSLGSNNLCGNIDFAIVRRFIVILIANADLGDAVATPA
jgi:hypothetical protein